MPRIPGLPDFPAASTPAADDEVPLYDTSAGVTYGATLADLAEYLTTSGSGISDAPTGGSIYARASAAWTLVPIQADAASDGNYYARRNGGWEQAPSPGISHAPVDGSYYASKDGAWASLGSVYQPLDADLTAIAGLTSAADRLPYFTGSGTAALATFTTAGRALVDDADAAAQRTTLGIEQVLGWALSDESTAITTGLAKVTDYVPFDCTLLEVFTGLSTQSSSGVVTVNVKQGGSTVFSTKPSIDASEDTSLTGTVAVLSTTALTKGSKLTFDIDAAGTGAKGLKVWLRVRQ